MNKKLSVEKITPGQRDKQINELAQQAVNLARTDFYTFVRLMAPVLLPEGFKDGKHIKIICKELEKVEASVHAAQTEKDKSKGFKGSRLQIFLPPGAMKSKLVSNLFVAWCLGRHPKWNILAIGHTTKFAEDNLGRLTKGLIQSPEYQEIFPECVVTKDVRAAGRWSTTAGGVYFCTGVGSKIAGRRAHLVICDDVVSEQEAFSPLKRNQINSWYVPGLRSRLLNEGAEIIVNTRWHVEDLSGYLLKMDEKSKRPWRVIKIPAILDYDSAKLLGLPVGSSFWPELWSLNTFFEFKASLPASKYNSLYLQHPTPDEGNIIKPDWWKVWKKDVSGNLTPPECSLIILSVDTAFGQTKSANYSAYTLWGVFNSTSDTGRENKQPNAILLGARKWRPQFHELIETIKGLYQKYEIDVLLIEKKGSGISLTQELERMGFPVFPYQPDVDKMARVYSCQPSFIAGRVYYPEGVLWAEEVRDEVCGFPFAPDDDYTDTTTQALLYLRRNYRIVSPGDFMYREDDDLYVPKRVGYWT